MYAVLYFCIDDKDVEANSSEGETFETKEWAEVEKSLRSAMRYRNMLVYGRFFGPKNGGKLGVRVEYFEGEPRKMELDQDRWVKIANVIHLANNFMIQLSKKIYDLCKSEEAHIVKSGDVNCLTSAPMAQI